MSNSCSGRIKIVLQLSLLAAANITLTKRWKKRLRTKNEFVSEILNHMNGKDMEESISTSFMSVQSMRRLEIAPKRREMEREDDMWAPELRRQGCPHPR